MDRRQFLLASLAAGAAALTGRMDTVQSTTRSTVELQDELPTYADWIPRVTRLEPEAGVVFSHMDRETLNEIEADEADEPEDEDPPAEDEEWLQIFAEVPILGIPFAGTTITSFGLLGILFYPFTGDLFPAEDDRSAPLDDGMGDDPSDNENEDEVGHVDGVRTREVTWTGDLFVFQGEYDPDIFADRYTEGFELVEERDGFTVYEGVDGFTEGMAFAVSTDTLVVGLLIVDDDRYDGVTVVTDTIDRRLEERDRIVDQEDGRWLFETTGDAQLSLGGWDLADLFDALPVGDDRPMEGMPGRPGEGPPEDRPGDGPSDGVPWDNHRPNDHPDPRPDVLDSDVAAVEHFVNTISVSVENGEIYDLEARFAGVYPDDAVPSEEAVRDHLIGNEEIPHEIVIENTRVHATATFEEPPEQLQPW